MTMMKGTTAPLTMTVVTIISSVIITIHITTIIVV